MDQHPGFFKVYIVSICSEEMLIPLAFSAQMKGAFPKQALLKNQRGKVWSVKITNKNNNFYFTNGWPLFVKSNGVEDGDFLTFIYDESRVFDVIIYGHGMCNKMVAEYEERVSEEWSDEETEEFDSDETYKESKEYVEEIDEEEFEIKTNKKGKRKLVETFEQLQISKGKEKGKIGETDHKRMEIVVRFEDDDDFENNGSTFEGFETGGNTSTKEDYKGKKAAKPKGKAKEKNVAKPKEKASDGSDDENEIFKYGIVARPKTPYFVTKLRPKRPNKLHIPLDVIRDFNLEIPEKMIILDENNKEWKTNVKVWTDGRYWLTNGWKAFRKWNVLTWHDRCLCEFVEDSGPRGLFLKIRILREGSWLPKEYN